MTPEATLLTLCQEIIACTIGVSELKLTGPRAVTVLFPSDMMNEGLGEEIIIEVIGLFTKPERTPAVRRRLAENLGRTVQGHFPAAQIECFVQPFDPHQGFWSSATPFAGQTATLERKSGSILQLGELHWSPFTSNGYKLLLHDDRELTMSAADLSRIEFVWQGTRANKNSLDLSDVRSQINGNKLVMLGPRFLQSLLSDKASLAWLWNHGIRTLNFLGAAFQCESTGATMFPSLYVVRRGKRKLWKWKMRWSDCIMKGFHYPVLPV
jgi:hypothetical protein